MEDTGGWIDPGEMAGGYLNVEQAASCLRRDVKMIMNKTVLMLSNERTSTLKKVCKVCRKAILVSVQYFT